MDDKEKLMLLVRYSSAVAESVRKETTTPKEVRLTKEILAQLLGRKPTDEEINMVLP